MPDDIQRILMIAPTPFFADRGCHVHIAEQAKALQRQEKQVLIVTYGIGREVPELTTRRTWRFPWYQRQEIGPSLHKLYIDIFLFLTSLRAAWQFKPDIIHAHLHEGCLIGWVIGKILKIPMIFDCQGSLTGELIAHNFILTRFQWQRVFWYRFEKWLDHLPAVIMAQSSEMKHELMERFSVPKNRIIMAYDGVNIISFKPQSDVTGLAKQLKIPPHHKVIIYLGGLTPHKGIDTLLKAFVNVRRQAPNTTLLLMGYPNEKFYLQQVNKLGISDYVRITGRINYKDASRYINLGTVAVAPKRTQTEANGKIYHYMACGIPTVAFDTVINREILGDLGVFAKPETDTAGLAQALVALLTNTHLQKRLAAQSRNKAVKDYSWDKVVTRIQKGYQLAKTPWQIQVFSISIRKKEKWHWLYPHLLKILTSPGAKKCLDVGSGVGTLSLLMEKIGGTWTFTETDQSAAAETKNVVQGSVKNIDIHDKGLLPGTYDLITILDVIEHVPDPPAFLARAQKLLTENGKIVLTTPSADRKFYWWRWVGKKIFGIDNSAHGHLVDGFSFSELKSLCDQANLVIEEASTFSRFFTELVELMYNGAYILRNQSVQRSGGYNLSLSPASVKDVRRNRTQFLLLQTVYPILCAISLLDHLLPRKHGYEWGVVARKNNSSAQ